jgi:LysR family transcriptional regulator for bpeEF and oprC
MQNLNTLSVFVKVAEVRSFTEAATLLGLTASGVSKSISRFEKELGVRLFHRTTRAVTLTNDGMSFYERCRHILMEINDAENSLNRTRATLHGRLRVHMPVGFGRRVIVPELVRFIELHPELTVDAELSDRIIDLGYEAFDAAVHIGDIGEDARVIARKLCNLRFVACAAPAYLEKHGEPASPDDLVHHHCLAYAIPQVNRYREWQFEKDGARFAKTVFGRLNLNNAESLLEAAVAGAGIAMISNFIAADSIRSGKLKCILTDYVTTGPVVSAVYLPSKHLSPKVRAFVDFLDDIVAGALVQMECADPLG